MSCTIEGTDAVTANDLDSFKALLDAHFPDHATIVPGILRIFELNLVLIQAAKMDRAAFMEALLAYPFHTYRSIAHAAIRARAKDTMLVLLAHGWDINETLGATGLTYLAYALTKRRPGDEEMALWLIAHGAGPNRRPVVDTTALSMAVQLATPGFVARLLDRCGGDLHCGQLLHHALDRDVATNRDKGTDDSTVDVVAVLCVLLDRGAARHLNRTMYADDAPSQGMYCFMDLGTPLHKAARQGNVAAVRYLLAQGADATVHSTRTKRPWTGHTAPGTPRWLRCCDMLSTGRAHQAGEIRLGMWYQYG
ncbi:hypothetical protein SCUCBS95973_001435 [Sporothrix curviconia]|uniref:Ankyrin repeat protein n=1 Tax=Sporothrix curviconia TaxID=1260050 RepID=A0ABP0AYJ9_9PEZI